MIKTLNRFNLRLHCTKVELLVTIEFKINLTTFAKNRL
jgi:hypothetical protein